MCVFRVSVTVAMNVACTDVSAIYEPSDEIGLEIGLLLVVSCAEIVEENRARKCRERRAFGFDSEFVLDVEEGYSVRLPERDGDVEGEVLGRVKGRARYGSDFPS